MEKLIQDLPTPVALVDIERLEKNISDMAAKAKENGVKLRPHIKTHKCIEIGKKQVNAGASGITVSTPLEAMFFAEAGFKDIIYAVPLAPDKFEFVSAISEKTDLKVLVDNPYTVDLLEEYCKRAQKEFQVLLKVDCGNHRCGVSPEDPTALKLANKIALAPQLEFKGILAHAGHSYSANSVDEIRKVAKQEQEVMVKFANVLKYESSELSPEIVSIGSTPTAQLADSFIDGITEIRPGNYVFFDYTQVALGSSEVNNCALTVQASVIGTYPSRVVIDAGATALSKDNGPTHLDNTGYGKIISNYSDAIISDSMKLTSLSQEHGNISTDGEHNLKPGDRLRIIPNHSCLTVNLYEHYFVVRKDSVIDKWQIRRQRL